MMLFALFVFLSFSERKKTDGFFCVFLKVRAENFQLLMDRWRREKIAVEIEIN